MGRQSDAFAASLRIQSVRCNGRSHLLAPAAQCGDAEEFLKGFCSLWAEPEQTQGLWTVGFVL